MDSEPYKRKKKNHKYGYHHPLIGTINKAPSNASFKMGNILRKRHITQERLSIFRQ